MDEHVVSLANDAAGRTLRGGIRESGRILPLSTVNVLSVVEIHRHDPHHAADIENVARPPSRALEAGIRGS